MVLQARRPAVAFGQLVPPDPGEVFAAVGAGDPVLGRQHRVRRYARRLRRARPAHQGRGRGPRLRAFLDLLARGDRLHRADRGRGRSLPPGASAPGAHPSRERAKVAVSGRPCRRHSRLDHSRGADVPARPGRARDPARIRLFACLGAARPRYVGQPHDDAPRPPLRSERGARRAPHHAWPAMRRRWNSRRIRAGSAID